MSDLVAKFLESLLTPVEVLGVAGQFAFFLRFLLQWIASEKRKAVVVPEAFWWCSIGGGLTMIVYAVFKPAPNLLLAQIPANFIYARNLVLSRRHRRALAAVLPEADDAGPRA